MDWDPNYAYAFVTFVVGALAGFQAIYERYTDESPTSVSTLPGSGYLISRGLVPALFFVLLYRTNQIHSYLLGIAIGLGLGTEAVLRSQIQVRSSKPSKRALSTENTFIGLFNLLDWYQKLTLESINTRMAAKRQKIVQQALRRIPKGKSFREVCEVASRNAEALSEPQTAAVRIEIERQLKEYAGEIGLDEGSTQEIEERYTSKLAYWIYRNAGRWHGLKVLLSNF